MNRLAWRSLRARTPTFAATGLSMVLGATVVLAFLSLLDTASAASVSAADREVLVTMATVVGLWGLVVVVFSVGSTLGLAVRQRSEEFALLRTTGATRRQLRRMVFRETLAVGVVAVLLAVVPGWLGGRLIVHLITDGGLVDPTLTHRLGPVALGGTAAVMIVAAVAASGLAVRRALRGSAVAARHDTGLGRWRGVAGVLLLAVGATYSTLTVTVMADADDPYAAMATAGPAGIFWALGLALLSPVLLRWAAAGASVLLARAGAPSWLAVYNARRRSLLLSGSLVPVIVFVGIGIGTLYLMSIENGASTLTGTVEGRTLALLNYVVVGLIAAFAAIMVVNTLVAEIGDRRGEFGRQRLAGSTRAQVAQMLLVEGIVIVVAGIVLGGLASLGTIVPYAVVKTDGWLPSNGPWLALAVAAVAVAVTLGATRTAGARALRGRAVDAAAAR